ncbi:hypothetical protein INR49_019400 [Caranx melampygus]|nr:hypothetical protein INR49_019400 [Caranx melampygus]
MWNHAPPGHGRLLPDHHPRQRHHGYQGGGAQHEECTFNVLTPGRRYTITVTTRSGKLNASVCVEGRTVPMSLQTINLSSGVDSLKASWEKPRGDVDSYTLTLLQDSAVVQNLSVPASSSSVLLPGLTPGALYRLQAATVSGRLQSKVTSLEGRTDPASVSEVERLQVSWRPAVGVVDNYVVHLQDRSQTVHTFGMSHSSPPECSFSSLVAGRLYSVVIVTISGDLQNSTTVQARTQPATVENLTAVHSGRDDLLKVTTCVWRHAAGDLDRYVVLISYNHSVLQNKTVSTGHSECVLSSLTPGRLYTVTVETWSGGYVSSVSTGGRTLPAAVGNLSLGNAGTSDLTVTWSPAPGDVDHYEAGLWKLQGCDITLTCLQVTLLFNDTRDFPPVTLDSEVRQYRLTSLTPGRLYKIVVSTFSGPNQTFTFIKGRTVPSPVGNLHMAPQPVGGLLVTWTPGDGDLDMYIVSLSTTDGVIETRPVPKHVTSLDFLDLTPGHAYTITIQSKSGELINQNTVTGRTVLMSVDAPAAPASVTALQADNDHTTHSLSVSWERPVGVYDGYRLQLLDEGGAVVANRSRAVRGADLRKRYRVKVVTLSGGVPSAEATADGQTRPAAVSNLTVTAVNTSSLSFSWRPSDGHVESYELSLYVVAEATANHRAGAAGSRKEHHQALGDPVDLQKVGSTVDSCVFSGLSAGSLYRLQVVSWSRDMSSDSSVLARTVPSPVSSLLVLSSGRTDRLTVSWQQGGGSWSSYQVLLHDVSGSTLGAQTLGAEHKSHMFPGLVPGRLYRAEVITHSGELTNSVSAFGRTSPEPPSHLSVKQGPTNDR